MCLLYIYSRGWSHNDDDLPGVTRVLFEPEMDKASTSSAESTVVMLRRDSFEFTDSCRRLNDGGCVVSPGSGSSLRKPSTGRRCGMNSLYKAPTAGRGATELDCFGVAKDDAADVDPSAVEIKLCDGERFHAAHAQSVMPTDNDISTGNSSTEVLLRRCSFHSASPCPNRGLRKSNFGSYYKDYRTMRKETQEPCGFASKVKNVNTDLQGSEKIVCCTGDAIDCKYTKVGYYWGEMLKQQNIVEPNQHVYANLRYSRSLPLLTLLNINPELAGSHDDVTRSLSAQTSTGFNGNNKEQTSSKVITSRLSLNWKPKITKSNKCGLDNKVMYSLHPGTPNICLKAKAINDR